MMTLDATTLQSYLDATYHVQLGDATFILGINIPPPSALLTWLNEHHHRRLLILTAQNPFGQMQPTETNQHLAQTLSDALSTQYPSHCLGTSWGHDAAQTWQENGMAVLDCSFEEAQLACDTWQQNAVVWLDLDASSTSNPQLLFHSLLQI